MSTSSDGPPELLSTDDEEDAFLKPKEFDDPLHPGATGSSSSSAPAGGAADVALPSTYTLQPHEGSVFIESIDGVCKVCHSLTIEKVVLPPGIWVLELHNGFAAVENAAGDVLLCEDLFTKQIYKCSVDQMLYVHDKAKKDNFNVTTRLRMYTPGTGTWHLKDLHNTETAMNYFQVYWPRGSMQTYMHVCTYA